MGLARSIAVDSIPEKYVDLYVNYLNGFSRLSVRESSGANIIKSLTGKDASVLIDPTLMFDWEFWAQFEQEPVSFKPEKYILTYFLSGSTDNKKVRQIAERYGLKCVDLLHDLRYIALGPSEFLWLFHHSEMVVTDSFHGTIFSILFNKPYYYYPRIGGEGLCSRFETLFSKLGIDPAKVNFHQAANPYIFNQSSIMDCLVVERSIFKDFLQRSLYDASI